MKNWKRYFYDFVNLSIFDECNRQDRPKNQILYLDMIQRNETHFEIQKMFIDDLTVLGICRKYYSGYKVYAVHVQRNAMHLFIRSFSPARITKNLEQFIKNILKENEL